MNRRFHIQLVPRGVVRQTPAEVEAEGRLLDGVALLIDIALGFVHLKAHEDPWNAKMSTVRHDEANFHCFIGPPNSKARIVVKRGMTALVWSEGERMAFAQLIARAYADKHGGSVIAPEEVRMLIYEREVGSECPPLFDDDGNRPRPAEESASAAGDTTHVTTRRR